MLHRRSRREEDATFRQTEQRERGTPEQPPWSWSGTQRGFSSSCVDPPLILINWLLDFVGIKSLVLTASTLQVLSFIPDLLKARIPFLENLKSLKVKNEELSYGLCMQLRDAKLQKAKSRKEAAKLKKELKANFTLSPPLPDGVVDFLLQNSPSTKVDIDRSSYTSLWKSVDIFRDY